VAKGRYSLDYAPHARLVLSDVRLVLSKLEDETNGREWRLLWCLAVVLLRTVGDVLHKVDAAADPRVNAVAGELYQGWKAGDDGAIFRDFIKSERDSIVHEYETAVTSGAIPVAICSDGTVASEEYSLHWLGENLYRPMGAGMFAGEDGRDVIKMAIAWWELQLDEINRRIAS
jgi:hypothetical protein